MDHDRRKQLMEEYKNRKPEMGVIALRCTANDAVFFGASRDTRADFNGLRFKLNSGYHPNRQLLALWQQYGEAGFVLSVAELLEYEDTGKDHSSELEAMLAQKLAQNDKAMRIW